MAASYPNPADLGHRTSGPLARWSRWLMVGSCTVALVLAAYLTFAKLSGQISELAGCGGPGGCAEILRGRWANWMRVPMSAWAMTVYLPLIALGLKGLDSSRQRILAVVGGSVLLGAATWFFFVQAIIEQQFCPYCMVMHGCGCLAFLAAVVALRSAGMQERALALVSAGLTTSLSMVALILGQLYGPQPASHLLTADSALDAAVESAPSAADTRLADAVAPPVAAADERNDTSSDPERTAPANSQSATSAAPATQAAAQPAIASHSVTSAQESMTNLRPAPGDRVVRYFDGAIELPLSKVPIIGSANAPHIMLKYFDYSCASCGQMHDDLAAALEAYPDELAVIVIPCPLHHDCNPYVELRPPGRRTGPGSHEFSCQLARLALAVWRADPTQFADYHDELFELQDRVSPKAAEMIASAKVGSEALQASLQDPLIDVLLGHSVGIYGRMKRRHPAMPKILLRDRVVLHGVATDTAGFLKILREQYRLGAPQANRQLPPVR